MKTHHVKSNYENERPLTAEEVMNSIRGNRSKAAVYLKGIRGREGVTQRQLADKLGTSVTAISEMENDKRPISHAMAIKLAKILRCNYKSLL